MSFVVACAAVVGLNYLAFVNFPLTFEDKPLEFKTASRPFDPLRAAVRGGGIALLFYMYSSAQGGIYFDEDDRSDNKQWWKLHKVISQGDKDIVRDGDTVRFENRYYNGEGLQPYDGDYVYSLDNPHDWVIARGPLVARPLHDGAQLLPLLTLGWP